jgi:hypothetical protein
MKMLEECEFSVGPLPSLNLVLGADKYQPFIVSKGGSIPTIYFGARGEFGTSGSEDVVDLYKNDGGFEGPVFMKTGRYSLQPAATSSSGDE